MEREFCDPYRIDALFLPLSQLERDGVPGYDPATDWSITLSNQTLENEFVAQEGIFSYSADGQNYGLIPEPSTALLHPGRDHNGAAAQWRRSTTAHQRGRDRSRRFDTTTDPEYALIRH